jgi:hypothetical protein
MRKHSIDVENSARLNVIRELFVVGDTSSEKDNCGLVSLGDMIDQGDLLQVRRNFGLPANGRLSGEELAKVAAIHQNCLIIVQVLYSDEMKTDEDGNVLVTGYGISLFVPSDDVCGIIVLLNEHGHFSPVSKAGGDLIFPEDIINAIASVDGSNYEEAQEIFSDFHEPLMLLDAHLKATFGL